MNQWISMELPAVQAVQRDLEQANGLIRRLHTLLLNTRRHAYLASAMERCRAEGRPPRGLVEFHAQYGEDCLLYELFEGKREGFFIEAGAFNGVDFSVSYAFEQLGWTGLLVEGIPERAEECRQHRPFSRVVHAALGAPGGPDTTTFLTTDDAYGGMISRRAGTPEERAHPLSPEMPRKEAKVPLRTLDSLLENHANAIDFVTLDLEGGELDALAGFNLLRFRPRVLLIEDMHAGKGSAIVEYVKKQSYTFAGWHEINALFIRSDEGALMERFARMTIFGW